MKWLWAVALIVLAGLQYRLWVGDGSLAHVAQLKQEIAEQARVNEPLLERHRVLTASVKELKQGLEPVGEGARRALGKTGAEGEGGR